VPVEVFREPVGKTVLKSSGTNQNFLVLFQNILIKWKSSAFVLKNSGTNQNILVLFQNFLIKWKSSTFVLKILEHIKTFSFCFKVFRLHGNVPISI
jgi:hypothetical protein